MKRANTDANHRLIVFLFIGFRYGRTTVLRWLLTEADQDAVSAGEMTNSGALELHYAAARGCLDCVKMLIESPALTFR